MTGKIYDITDAKGAKENIPDLITWGDGDAWKLLSKASSKSGEWMKSTKAMEIEGLGCLVQVTTQQGNNIAEAVEFVPLTTIVDVKNQLGELVGRRLALQTEEGPSDG
jgi:hypothetical protein